MNVYYPLNQMIIKENLVLKDFQLIGFNRKTPKNNCIIYCIEDKKE